MKVLVIGSGAREHALCWALSRDTGVDHIVCAPGNAGLATAFPTVPADVADPAMLLALAEAQDADLTVVGPEVPLDRGVVDLFEAEGRPIFGPRRAAARLETSKAFAKAFMARHGVSRPRATSFARMSSRLATSSAEVSWGNASSSRPMASQPGRVSSSQSHRRRPERAVTAAMVDRAFGDAGAAVVLEERLEGPEVSFFVIADGERAVPLVAAQDHKRIFDGDRGPNTGGMGAFAPSRLVGSPPCRHASSERSSRPVLRGARR